jgi:hypothetical protein
VGWASYSHAFWQVRFRFCGTELSSEVLKLFGLFKPLILIGSAKNVTAVHFSVLHCLLGTESCA